MTDAICALNDSWLSRTTPRFLAVGTEVTIALSMEIVRSCLGQDLAGKKSSSVLSGFSFRWWADIHCEMSARHAAMRSSTWVAEGGKDKNS